MPTPTKRDVLNQFSPSELQKIAQKFNITNSGSQDELVASIAASKKATLVRIFEFLNLGRDRLKEICSALNLDTSGKEKQTILERIIGRPPDSVEESLPPGPLVGPMAQEKSNQNNAALGGSPGQSGPVAGPGANQNNVFFNISQPPPTPLPPTPLPPTPLPATLPPQTSLKSLIENHLGLAALALAAFVAPPSAAVGYNFEKSRHEATIEAIRTRGSVALDSCGVMPSARPADPAEQFDVLKTKCGQVSSAPAGSSDSKSPSPIASSKIIPVSQPCPKPPIPQKSAGGKKYHVDIAKAKTPTIPKEIVVSVGIQAQKRLGIYWKGYQPAPATRFISIEHQGVQPVFVATWDGLVLADAVALCEYLKCEGWTSETSPDVLHICEYSE